MKPRCTRSGILTPTRPCVKQWRMWLGRGGGSARHFVSFPNLCFGRSLPLAAIAYQVWVEDARGSCLRLARAACKTGLRPASPPRDRRASGGQARQTNPPNKRRVNGGQSADLQRMAVLHADCHIHQDGSFFVEKSGFLTFFSRWLSPLFIYCSYCIEQAISCYSKGFWVCRQKCTMRWIC